MWNKTNSSISHHRWKKDNDASLAHLFIETVDPHTMQWREKFESKIESTGTLRIVIGSHDTHLLKTYEKNGEVFVVISQYSVDFCISRRHFMDANCVSSPSPSWIVMKSNERGSSSLLYCSVIALLALVLTGHVLVVIDTNSFISLCSSNASLHFGLNKRQIWLT